MITKNKQNILRGDIMGAGGVPNRTIERIDGRSGDLPIKGAKPNSRYDLYVNGEKIQSRWFDSEGKVIRNRDFYHQNAQKNHKFPHDHNWVWVKEKAERIRENLIPDYDLFN